MFKKFFSSPRLLDIKHFDMPIAGRNGERVLRGIPVSNGVCRGRVLVLATHDQAIPRIEVSEQDVPAQLHRYEQAMIQTRHQIQEVQRQVSLTMDASEAMIFDAHLLLLDDPMLVDEVTRCIQKQRVSAEYAFQQSVSKYAAALAQVDDDYLRERVADLKDVAARLLRGLLGTPDENQLSHLTEPSIIISHDLTPSTTAVMDKKMVLGFATNVGSKTSHTAILARALQIPAVVGLGQATQEVVTGQYALLDGYTGTIIINPTDQTLFEYGQLVIKQLELKDKLKELRDQPAITLDGSSITLSANIEQLSDVEAVKSFGADGVGLYRTEFLYLNRDTLPTEDEQYEAYRQVAEALRPHPVIIRTLDLGGDKFLTRLNISCEHSSFYGWRAIRFCLQQQDLFKAQLRAILRSSTVGNVKLMYPMISGPQELKQANELLEQCRVELQAEGKAFNPAMEVGAMIEIPSAALAAESLAKQVNFFSIGTNDLIQYTLAVDRLNERVAHLYEPTHPAVIRLIAAAVQTARKHGIWVGVCGEMAGDPVLALLLLGMGVDELSVSPPMVPQIKFLLRRLKLEEARQLAQFALTCECGTEILEHAQKLAHDIAPGLFEV
jgi:phosphotransferase system enzyme I (PtsI)